MFALRHLGWCVAALIAALTVPSPAEACSCGGSLPSQEVREADFIFEGTIRRWGTHPIEGTMALVEVSRVFKGPSQKWVIVTSGPCGGVMYDEPSYYFLRGGGGTFWDLGVCNSNHPITGKTPQLYYSNGAPAGGGDEFSRVFKEHHDREWVRVLEGHSSSPPVQTFSLVALLWLEPWLGLSVPASALGAVGLVALRLRKRRPVATPAGGR